MQTLPDTAARSLFYSLEIVATAAPSPGVLAAVIQRTVKVNDSDTTPGRARVMLI